MTKSRFLRRTLYAFMTMGISFPALAHVAYVDLNGPANHITTDFIGTSIADGCAAFTTGCMSSLSFTKFGWANGTTDVLGDSHYVTTDAEFWKFHLDANSDVTINFTQGQAGLDPAFSVYSGLLPVAAHDDTPLDPLNPTTPSPPFPKQPSPSDARLNPDNTPDTNAADYYFHDGFRDTKNHTYIGQFDAFANWSMSNGSTWSKIDYLASTSARAVSVTDSGGTVHSWGGNGNHNTAVGTGESLTLFNLAPGDYFIAAGGEAASTTLANGGGTCTAYVANGCTAAALAHFYGTVTFSAVPVSAVPVPAAVWLFGSALAGMGFFGRRRNLQSD